MSNLKHKLRKRILFLVDALDHEYQSGVAHGVVRAARRLDTDLMILVGGQMVFDNKHLEKRKFVYELAAPSDFDGVVMLGTSLSSQEGLSAIAPLIIRFASLPTVSIGLDIGKGANILVDNATGMTKITEHLLDVHEYRRFAYISGPPNNKEAGIRLKAFKQALASQGLKLPPDHLVEGAFTEASGEQALRKLIDEHGVDITALDALVAANDSMAVGAIDELKRRGLQVPQDVAVVGFDDIEAARYADTPLTTVQQPLIMQGERAVEEVLHAYGPTSLDTEIIVGPKLVIRRSCGCGADIESPTLSTSPPGSSSETLHEVLERKRINIETDLATVAERGGISRGWEKDFVDAVIECAAGKGYRRVTEAFAGLVRKSIQTGEGVQVWTMTLAALDKHLTMLVHPGTEDSIRVEALLHRSRSAMAEAVEHFHATKVRQLRNRTFAFNQAAITMLTTHEVEELVDAAAEHLPKLGIETCSIAFFEDRASPTPTLKPVLVLVDGERIENTAPFSSHLIAAPALVEDRPHALVVEPLCFYDELYGVAALEYGPSEGGVYEQLGAFISAATRSAVMRKSDADAAPTHPACAHVDELTGSFTRVHLAYRFREEIARAEETGRPLSLILMDMDDFAKLNEALGRDMGDTALVGAADTIRRCVKPTQIVFRLEDDTFAVLMPDTDADRAKSAASLIARRLKRALAFQYHGHIAASLGVSTAASSRNINDRTLMEGAVRALLHAKRSGKDRAVHVQDITT